MSESTPTTTTQQTTKQDTTSNNGGGEQPQQTPHKYKRIEIDLTGVNRDVTRAHVEELCSKYGRVNDIEMTRGREGFSCFVTFGSTVDAEFALYRLYDHVFMGTKIKAYPAPLTNEEIKKRKDEASEREKKRMEGREKRKKVNKAPKGKGSLKFLAPPNPPTNGPVSRTGNRQGGGQGQQDQQGGQGGQKQQNQQGGGQKNNQGGQNGRMNQGNRNKGNQRGYNQNQGGNSQRNKNQGGNRNNQGGQNQGGQNQGGQKQGGQNQGGQNQGGQNQGGQKQGGQQKQGGGQNQGGQKQGGQNQGGQRQGGQNQGKSRKYRKRLNPPQNNTNNNGSTTNEQQVEGPSYEITIKKIEQNQTEEINTIVLTKEELDNFPPQLKSRLLKVGDN